MLAELFNALVSKLFTNEYRELAMRYYNERILLFRENSNLMSRVAELVKQAQKIEAGRKRAEAEVQELQTTLKTARRLNSSGSDEQKQLLNAAMMNIAAKETIIKLQTDLRCKTAELERCHKAAESEKAFHETILQERNELVNWKAGVHKAASAAWNATEYNGFKHTLRDAEFNALFELLVVPVQD
jgi:small-conductance mechanosensitive channel